MEVGGVLPLLKMVGAQNIPEEGWIFIDGPVKRRGGKMWVWGEYSGIS